MAKNKLWPADRPGPKPAIYTEEHLERAFELGVNYGIHQSLKDTPEMFAELKAKQAAEDDPWLTIDEGWDGILKLILDPKVRTF